jgi:hypothetical protein
VRLRPNFARLRLNLVFIVSQRHAALIELAMTFYIRLAFTSGLALRIKEATNFQYQHRMEQYPGPFDLFLFKGPKQDVKLLLSTSRGVAWVIYVLFR